MGPEASKLAGTPTGAVFLSYASQDTEAAGRICDALRAEGIEVWFDQSELRGGDAWDAMIRRQIRTCALFIPIVSQNTRARAEGYFRLEWKLAVDRSHLIAANRAFILPVVIDATPQEDESVPDRFRELQWTRLPGGETCPAFVARVAGLISGESPSATAGTATPSSYRSASPPMRNRRAFWVGLGLAALALALGSVWLASRHLALDRSAEAGLADQSARSLAEKSIAVVPFVDMSEKHDQEYFSDGLTEELIDLLTKVPELQVSARTSSFYFKGKPASVAEIASALHVSHILEGSVRKTGDSVRITAELIRTDNGFHLWSQTFDRDLHDILKLQHEIAASVVEAMRLPLHLVKQAAATAGVNSGAYELYLRGLQSERRGSTAHEKEAVQFYEQAVASAPQFALAWARLSVLYRRNADGKGGTPASDYARARQAAARAVSGDPLLPEAHVVLGEIYKSYDWNWTAARAEFQRALELDSTNPAALTAYGGFIRMMGQSAEAVGVCQQGVERDPLNPKAHSQLGWALWIAARLPEAEAEYRKAIELAPDTAVLRAFLGLVVARGHPEEAVREIDREPNEQVRTYALAIASYANGSTAQADQLLKGFIQQYGESAPGAVAQIYARRGANDDAFRWLERAYATRDEEVTGLLEFPAYRGLRRDPRYLALIQRLNLPEPAPGS
jgi:TolB-like protein/Tfp pilus assembly protein PilF